MRIKVVDAEHRRWQKDVRRGSVPTKHTYIRNFEVTQCDARAGSGEQRPEKNTECCVDGARRLVATD